MGALRGPSYLCFDTFYAASWMALTADTTACPPNCPLAFSVHLNQLLFLQLELYFRADGKHDQLHIALDCHRSGHSIAG